MCYMCASYIGIASSSSVAWRWSVGASGIWGMVPRRRKELVALPAVEVGVCVSMRYLSKSCRQTVITRVFYDPYTAS
jgi:hypothetical protein